MTDGLRPAPDLPGRVIDAQLHLLDRQVLDVGGVPVTAIDDLELEDVPRGEDLPAGQGPRVTALLHGASTATRIFGGRVPDSRLLRIDWRHVAAVGAAIQLAVHGADLDSTWIERWVRDRIVARIPGGRHDPQ